MASRANADADHVIIGGVSFKRRIKTTSSVWGPTILGLPGTYEIELTSEFDDASGRYITTSVTVAAHGGGEVTGEVLRGLKVDDLLRHSLGPFNGVPDEHPADLLELGKAGPTDETLRAVARVYEIGLAILAAPTQRVAEAFGVPRSTAGRWVTRARDRGYLTGTDPRAPHSGNRKQRADG